jgi:malonyl-CoA decarboxylase
MRVDSTRLRRASIVNLTRTWRGLKSTARHAFKGEVHPDLPKEDMDYLQRRMIECAEGKGGEVSARLRSTELGHIYLSLNQKGRERFLKILAREFSLDRERVLEQFEIFRNAKDEEGQLNAVHALRECLESPRLKILRHFNTLDDGFKFLVDMRADLLSLNTRDVSLKGLEKDLKYLLGSLFDIGLLDMEQITWSSPAALLEKLIQYEAVHAISSWGDLKNRLDSDRRCFAFFHNKMPNEPLIFIEVALVQGLADNVQTLLNEQTPAIDPEEADTAIFYSINNAQKGLVGISFGNFLIKWVVTDLSASFKNLKAFATLSPVPGFRGWLNSLLEKGDVSILGANEIQTILRLKPGDNAGHSLLELLNSGWHKDEKVRDALKQPLMGLVAHYIVNEKKGKKALDSVTHFHITNGASLERINWLADASEKGMRESAGIMVNYLYKRQNIDEYHEDYSNEGKVHFSRQVKDCFKQR